MIAASRKALIQYQYAHLNKWNQRLHYWAFLFAFLAWFFVFFNWRITVLLAIMHYGCSWVGHFGFEKNKPASFKHPFLGFFAGFLWFFLRSFELISGKKVLPNPYL